MIGSFPFILLCAIAFAIYTWLSSRPSKSIMPTDTFVIMALLTSGFVPFINLRGDSDLSVNAHYSDATIASAVICLSLMYTCFGFVWLLRSRMSRSPASPIARKNLILLDDPRAQRVANVIIIGFLALSVVALLYPAYARYKVSVLQFLAGGIDASDYQFVRRVAFSEDNFINLFIGRLRYSVFAVAFVLLEVWLIGRLKLIGTAIVMAIVFLIGPASMSKAPIVVYFAYSVIAAVVVSGRISFLRIRYAIIGLAIAFAILLTILAGVYYLQYPGLFKGLEDVPRAYALAYFRVFVAIYIGLLQYLTAFPDGGAGIGGTILAPLFGTETRNLDQEVAIYFLGPRLGQLTTFPTVFIGNAYASFGYLGVVVYSLIVAAVLWWVDAVYYMMRARIFRIAYYSVMLVNTIYFAILAAPTVLLTQGVLVIPVMLLIADRFAIVAGRPTALTRPRRVPSRMS